MARRFAPFRLSRIIRPSSRPFSNGGDAERTFERLREQNRGGSKFSFVDGPITANSPMGVHHAWGRTLKDVFQRYQAMRGTSCATRTASTARASGSRSRSRSLSV
jgi:hypothetical protein